MQVRYGQIADHLCNMGIVELGNDLGVGDYDVLDNEIRHETVDQYAFVAYLEPLLLLYRVATFR
jgi:hypothetical protein